MQEICDLFSADYDFLVQIVEKLRCISRMRTSVRVRKTGCKLQRQ